MKNRYTYNKRNNTISIELKNRNGDLFSAIIDFDDFEKVNKYNGTFFASYREGTHSYYCCMTLYLGKINKKYKYRTLYLHQIIMDTIGKSKLTVDHKNNNTLDNKRNNLIIVKRSKNSQNRKGANRNNNTGHRNVSFIDKTQTYWVQIMKNGIKYKWEFKKDELEKAIKFAEQKRLELFGLNK